MPEQEADALIRKARLAGDWSKEDAERNRPLQIESFRNRARGVGATGVGVYAAGPWGSSVRDPVPGFDGKPYYHQERYDGATTMQFQEASGAPTLYPGDVRGIQREAGDRLVLTGYLDAKAKPIGDQVAAGLRRREYEMPASAKAAPGEHAQRFTVATDVATGALRTVSMRRLNPTTKAWDECGLWAVLRSERRGDTWLVREAEVARSRPSIGIWRREHYTFKREQADPRLPFSLLAGMPRGMNVIDHSFGVDHQIDYKYGGKRLSPKELLNVKRERETYAQGLQAGIGSPSPALLGAGLLFLSGAIAFGRRGRSTKPPSPQA